MLFTAVICNIVTATTCVGFVTGTEQFNRGQEFKSRLFYCQDLCFGHGTSSVDFAQMPMTPRCPQFTMTGTDNKNKLELSLDNNKLELSLHYLTGYDLERRIADTADNNRALVRFDRQTQQYIFPKCDKCDAPKIIHRQYEFQNCVGTPTKDSIQVMLDELRQVKGIEKFAVISGHDDIDKFGGVSKRRRSKELPEDLPEGKRLDIKITPSKVQTNVNEEYNNDSDVNCDVVEDLLFLNILKKLRKRLVTEFRVYRH